MQKPWIIFLLLLVPLLTSNIAIAAASSGLQVRNAYVRGLPPGVANTAAYMTLVNNSDADIVLIGAETTAAKSASLHATLKRGGGMTMEHVMSATIPAKGSLELKTGGLHLMLMGLKRPLGSGDTVRLILKFEGGFVQTMDVPVVSVLDE
jgi:copper(I)-binding protein